MTKLWKPTRTPLGTWFPHLHIHDEHSVKDGCSSAESYGDRVVELKGRSLAVTNHGQAAGFARQYFTCEDRGIKPIFGMEAYLNEHRLKPVREVVAKLREEVKKKTPGAQEKLARADAFLKASFRPSRHIILLAKNLAGYRNLVRMSTDSWRRGFYYVPRTDTAFLAEHAEGLIFSTACIGGYIPKMAREDFPAAVAEARRLQRIFVDGFFVELMITGYHAQRETNQTMLRLADEIGAPLILTCDVHYAKPEDQLAQRCLLLMRDKKTITAQDAGEGGWQFESKDLYWRTLEDLQATWQEFHADYLDRATFLQAVKNTYELEASIEHVKFDTSLKLPGIFERPEALLREAVVRGLKDRIDRHLLPAPGKTKREYVERVHRELGIITSKGFAEYFLLLQDVTSHARSIGARMGPGRGSAGGSLVAYVLGITDIDPLRFSLLFERFLAVDRTDAPDIDLDFSPEHRDAIKAYIEKRYPATATVGTFATFKPRATLQDVGRVFDIPYQDMLAVTKPLGTDADKIPWSQVEADFPTVLEFGKKYPEAWRVVRTLRGLISHRGKHAAAILIGPASAFDDVPLMLGPDNLPGQMVTAIPDTQGDGVEYDGRELTRLGYLKLDVLGVRNVNVVPRAIEILTRVTGQTVDVERLPLDDPATLEVASSGDVPGIFQFDTHVSRPILKLVGIDSFDDLAAVTSLARPGPLVNKLHHQYAKLKTQGDAWKKLVPESVHGVLAKSRGLMIYQEDVMFVLHLMGGMTMVEANKVRKIVGKKLDSSTLDKWRSVFVEGGVRLGHERERLDEIFSSLYAYAQYAFNASHAVAYALTAYRQLYMLAHHPLCYFGALLAETPRGKKAGREDEEITNRIRAALGRGVRVLPPDLNESLLDFEVVGTVEDPAIRYGLSKVKGVGGAADEILATRGESPFASLEDFHARINRRRVNARAVSFLALSGAFDGLPLEREPAGWTAEDADSPLEERNRFLLRWAELQRGPVGPRSKKEPEKPETFTEGVLRDKERELLGIALSWWASKEKDELRTSQGLWTIADALSEGIDRFGVIGEVVREKVINGRKGQMAFLVLADETGQLENVTIWSEQWKAWRERLKRGRLVVVHFWRRENQDSKYGRYSYFLDDRRREGPPVQSVAALLRGSGGS